MPPVVRRQEMRVPGQQVQVEDILSTSVPVSKLREEYVKICFYGRNRSGKTTLAAEFASESKPLLFISCEPDSCGGATSVSNIPNVFLQRVSHRLLGQDEEGRWLDATDHRCVRRDTLKGSDKIRAIGAALSKPHKFTTVVVDTVTSLQDIILTEIMGWEKVPEMMPDIRAVGKENYQYRAEKWRATINPILDLQNCNVIILAQEKDHNPEKDDFGGKRKILHTMQQGSFMAPSLGSTNAGWLQDNCGYLIQIYEDEVMQEIVVPMNNPDGTPAAPITRQVPTGRRQRHLRLLYHPNFAAGGRWQFDRNVPEFVTAPTPRELYREMAKFIPALGN